MTVPAPTPHHACLFFCAEAEFFIKPRPSGAEPKELHPLEAWMIKDAPDDLGPHPVPLVCPIDDHIPDRCAIDKVGEYSTEPDKTIPLPSTECQIGMAQHFLRIIKGSALGP